MFKTATINTRIDPALKSNAEVVLHKIGLSPAEAIRLFHAKIFWDDNGGGNFLVISVRLP